MKAFKIPKEESAYVCVPITQDDACIDTSTLTDITMILVGTYGTTKELAVEAMSYSGIVAKIENVACGSYTLKAAGKNSEGIVLAAECQMEVVHYDSQVNVKASKYKTLPLYIFDASKQEREQKAIDLRVTDLESQMEDFKNMDDLDADDVRTIFEATGAAVPLTEEERAQYLKDMETVALQAVAAGNSANQAQASAESAATSASEASTAATSAAADSANAVSTLASIIEAANEAKASASNAEGYALKAQGDADDSYSYAKQAGEDAEQAKKKANNAVADAKAAIQEELNECVVASSNATTKANNAAASAAIAEEYSEKASTSLKTIKEEIDDLDVSQSTEDQIKAVNAKVAVNTADISTLAGTGYRFVEQEVTESDGIVSSVYSGFFTVTVDEEGNITTTPSETFNVYVKRNETGTKCHYTAIPISAGERYKISGYGANHDFCGVFLQNTATGTLAKRIDNTYNSDDTELAFVDIDTQEIPEGYNMMYINGWDSKQGIVVKKYMLVTKTPSDFQVEFEQAKTDIKAKLNTADLTSSEVGTKYATQEIEIAGTDDLFSSSYNKSYREQTGNDSKNGEYVAIPVQVGESYKVSGYSVNSDYCGAFIMRTKGTISSAFRPTEANLSGAAFTDVEVDINSDFADYDSLTLYVNGNSVTQPVKVKKEVAVTLADVVETVTGGSDEEGEDNSAYPIYVHCTKRPNALPQTTTLPTGVTPISSYAVYVAINRRLNDTYDSTMRWGNKDGNTINSNFDFTKVMLVPRGTSAINTIHKETDMYSGAEVKEGFVPSLYGGSTDYIQPIVVAAVNNIDGDNFEEDAAKELTTEYKVSFTGGFHGFHNSSAVGEISYGKETIQNTSTMTEVSKVVKVDGKVIDEDEGHAYGNVCTVDVVNYIQGYNTEKHDGTGRAILRQNIHLKATRDTNFVSVEFIALEEVNIYQINAFALQIMAEANGKLRLVGSNSKKGEYTNILQSSTGKYILSSDVIPDAGDHGVNTLRVSNDKYKFECEIDKTFGEGDYRDNQDKRGCVATQNAGKAYFYLNDINNAINLKEGEMITFRGWYTFSENN